MHCVPSATPRSRKRCGPPAARAASQSQRALRSRLPIAANQRSLQFPRCVAATPRRVLPHPPLPGCMSHTVQVQPDGAPCARTGGSALGETRRHVRDKLLKPTLFIRRKSNNHNLPFSSSVLKFNFKIKLISELSVSLFLFFCFFSLPFFPVFIY